MDPANKVYYVDENTLMVVSSKGKIRILNTPFKVFCITSIDNLKDSTWYTVDKVAGKDHSILFEINKARYHHHHFRIFIVWLLYHFWVTGIPLRVQLIYCRLSKSKGLTERYVRVIIESCRAGGGYVEFCLPGSFERIALPKL